QGGELQWPAVFPTAPARVELPTYAFQRQRYWASEKKRGSEASPPSLDTVLRQLSSVGGLSESERGTVTRLVELLETDRAQRWMYELKWRALAPADVTESRSGQWLVLEEGAEVSARLRDAFERAGQRCRLISQHGLSEALGSESPPCAGVVLPTRAIDGTDALLALRSLVASEHPVRCWLVTEGAVAAADDDPVARPDQSAIWGIGRAFSLEHPRAWGGLMDLPPGPVDDALADRAVASLCNGQGEDQIALRRADGFVPRLVPTRRTELSAASRWATSDAALVTGGLGAVGLHVCRWLVARGARHLVIANRRGHDAPGAQEAVRALEALGAEVTVCQVDVSDLEAMERHMVGIRTPIRSVFHLAGVVDATPMLQLTPARIEEIMRAKCEGTRTLERLSRDWTLDAFVCFSSIAGAWGSGGQAAYAGANAFLDGWAQQARAAGRPALSISWGPWGGSGRAAELDAREYLARRGLPLMDPDRAIASIDNALSRACAHLVIADVEWGAFRKGYEAFGTRPLLAELERSPDDESREGLAEQQSWVRSLAELPAARCCREVVDRVLVEVAKVAGLPGAEGVQEARPLGELGFDSLMAVELRAGLAKAFATTLPATLVFDHPTPRAVAAYLMDRLGLSSPADTGGDASAESADLEAEMSVDQLMDLIDEDYEAIGV
ncbi:MAG: beta-ketoacyl reductase, partial [Myxococcales bacterium]|nr:beta-ketoacyl reductase [Myxococcales bacterium]